MELDMQWNGMDFLKVIGNGMRFDKVQWKTVMEWIGK